MEWGMIGTTAWSEDMCVQLREQQEGYLVREKGQGVFVGKNFQTVYAVQQSF